MTTPFTRRQWLTAAALAGLIPVTAQAAFPERPITVIVPYPPGSAPDVATRLVATEMQARLGAPVIISNREGASGVIGTAAGARSAPDGYSLTLVASPAVLATQLLSKPGFDLSRDFVPVGAINEFFNVLVVSSRSGIRSFAELAERARQSPGKLNFATAGNATPSDIGGRTLAKRHGLSLTFIPYKGSTPALHAVVSGEADVSILVVGPVLSHAKNGGLKPLAVLSKERTALLSDVQDADESGVGVLVGGWTGLAAPAGTPASHVARLNEVLNLTLRNESVVDGVVRSGAKVLPGSPEALRQLIERDLEETRSALAALGLAPGSR